MMVTPALLSAQAPSNSPAAPSSKTQHRTPWGHPDLQGVWDVDTGQRLERPRLSMQETKDLQDELIRAGYPVTTSPTPSAEDRATAANPEAQRAAAANAVQRVAVDPKKKGWIIVDPPDGWIPPMTPAAQARDIALGGLAQRPDNDERLISGKSEPAAFAVLRLQMYDDPPKYFEDPELRSLGERCLMALGSAAGPPILRSYYDTPRQIIQTPNTVVIVSELIHDQRVVRLTDKHLPKEIRRWLGDSIGRWEGDTLVVETTNFTNKTRFRGSTEELKVTERFRRVDDKTLSYRFTIDDPHTWAQRWSGEYEWTVSPPNRRIFEYSCHEGNFALTSGLQGARQAEAAAAESSETKQQTPKQDK
jgi:hypothetical protein